MTKMLKNSKPVNTAMGAEINPVMGHRLNYSHGSFQTNCSIFELPRNQSYTTIDGYETLAKFLFLSVQSLMASNLEELQKNNLNTS